ncbi:MAG: ATPase, T2SS/T4P/T4SS family [Candidatus Binatia bacterium]
MKPIKAGEASLIKFLVHQNLVSGDDAQTAAQELARQENGASILDLLERKGLIGEEQVAQKLADRLRIPYVNLPAVALDPAVIALVREELATRHKVVPLRADLKSLILATANPLDRDALHAIEFATGLRVHPEVATLTAVRDAIGHAYHLDEALNQYLRGVNDEKEIPVAELPDEPVDVKSLLRGTEVPPVVKLLNLILLEGIRTGASDIHIEADVALVRVRQRIDGILEESFRLPKWVQDPLLARCKVLAKLDITERRVPQDGRIHLRFRERMIDLRLASLPTQYGEKVTMRILDPGSAPTGLDQLQLSPRDLQCVRQAIARPEGMVLVTGPTGSGKTTTLYAMLAETVSPKRNVVTIENPIEYQLPGANQVEINEKQGLTFAGTLRSILRQDPDVILVGEIRDNETAEVALRASQTGHLVLSTLHTNDSVSAITRLIDIGIEPYMLASSLHLIVAQRLVRLTCERCADPYEPDPMQLRVLGISELEHQFRRGVGCSSCRKSGYVGRRGVYEVMQITPEVAKLIESKASEATIRAQARQDGMKLLPEHAVEIVCADASTPEEVLRVVDIAQEEKKREEKPGASCPNCSRAVEEAFSLCPHCGTPLLCKCGGCGKQLQLEWQICPFCGAPTGRKETTAPSAPSPQASVPPPVSAPRAPDGTSESRRYRALVVDDTADFRRLISFTLERGGLSVSVETASNGREAIEKAQDNPPDFIVLDIMMPEMDGFEVCQRLRSDVRTAFVPILMLTALDDAANRARGFLAGTDDYIGKPFARAELLARVRRLIERTYGTTLPSRTQSMIGERVTPPSATASA